MSPLVELRHEFKFVAPWIHLPSIETWLAVHSARFWEAHPPRQVNNVYFDTHDLDAYGDNLAGISARFKVRLRWYGEDEDVDSGTLEVKHRRAGLGFKESFAAGELPLAGTTWRRVLDRLRREVTAEGRSWLNLAPVPVLINCYRRRYFEVPGSSLRATLDWRQRVYDQRPHPRPNLSRRGNLPDRLILELKFPPRERELAAEVLASVPLRRGRSSKYVAGVQAVLGA